MSKHVKKSSPQCPECKKYFSHLAALRTHLQKCNPTKIDEFRKYKISSNFKFSCTECGKNFSLEYNLRRHKKMHQVDNSEPENVGAKKCPICSFRASYERSILQHFLQAHKIKTVVKELNFASDELFLSWKSSVEGETDSKFSKTKVKYSKSTVITKYNCHRSGEYVPTGKGLRRLKSQGSNKINAYCPASIKSIKNMDTGQYNVEFVGTHVGHEPELGHLYLTLSERQNLAQKIAAKIPFDDILNSVRDSVSDSNLKRVHLVTRKDLHNIERSFNLCSTAVRHSNDVTSVDTWVNQMTEEGCVLFYKLQGTVLADHQELFSEDFVLILMTSEQSEYLKKYGSDVVCIDGSYGFNSYGFEMNTLLVLDDVREGFPCSFLISNRSDQEVLSIFFSKIKEHADVVSPNVFMSDIEDSCYDAWLETMGVPEKRLFCTWQVDRAWRKNLQRKIKSKELQVAVYKKLRTMLEEYDIDAFEKMLEQFLSSDDTEISEFLTYFEDNYVRNTQFWAFCYHLHADINTNMHLEQMHKSLKYIYLKGKNVKRLDESLYAIMKFVKDKLFENKSKVFKKVDEIRHRHNNIADLDSTLIVSTEDGWEVPSKNTDETYFIEEKIQNCKCQLICSDCNICIHRYCCSCMDSSIKFNMCKHIHLLGMFRKTIDNSSTDKLPYEIELSNSNLQIESDFECEENEKITIIMEDDETVPSTSIEERKENIKQTFLKHLDKIDSHTKLDIVDKIMAPLSATLAAATEAINCTEFYNVNEL